jgi:hypothetical protein
VQPNGESQINFEVPQSTQGEVLDDDALEKLPSSPENKAQQSRMPVVNDDARAMAVPSQTTVTAIINDTTSDDSPQNYVNAKDSDRIDKVWIDKAKEVISKTKNDPFEQKQQISRVKAQYVKSRYNKTLKTDDAVAK